MRVMAMHTTYSHTKHHAHTVLHAARNKLARSGTAHPTTTRNSTMCLLVWVNMWSMQVYAACLS